MTAKKDDKKAKVAGKVALNNDLQEQIAQLTDALQRERADAVNIRRQHDEKIASLKTLVKTDIIQDFLPVVDNIERALKHVPADLEGNDFVKGVQAIAKQFEKTFTDLGVERIATVGAVFDPNLHEAISMEEGDGDKEIITEELQSGYKVGDDVIRHAMVRVKG